MTVNNIDKDTEDQVEKNKIEEDKQEEHEGNGFITFLALAALFFFPFILLCAWLFPEYLPFFGLNVKMCYMIVLQLISLIFMLFVLQKPQLDFKWQITCIVFAFILVGESYFLLFS